MLLGGNLALSAPTMSSRKQKCKNVSTTDLNFNSLCSVVHFGCNKVLYSVNLKNVNRSVVLLLCLLQLVSFARGSIMGEECDWSGSGLQPITSGGRGVTPVYLRCSQGSIAWSYPRGALRVLLRLGSTGRDFRGCIKVEPSFAGARLFLEGSRSLSLLYAPSDGADPRLVRCFHSSHAQAAIYVESEAGDGAAKMFPKQVAAFAYDLEPLAKHRAEAHVYDITDDCRPCSNDELTQAFCTSDLVVSGWISLIENKYELEVSEVNVKVSKFLRRSIIEESEGAEVGNSVGVEGNADGAPRVQLQLPSHCRIKPTDGGQFVFMARKKLGDNRLLCAPRLKEWKALVKTDSVRNGAHCVLRS